MRLSFLLTLVFAICAAAQEPATQNADKLPFVKVDVEKKQVRVECEVIGCEAPLEFFAVVAGGPEHEAVLRTRAKPSHIHLALLMLGLQDGEPIKYSQAANKWFPPHGPPLHLTVEFTKNGKTESAPANRFMRDIKTKRPMPPLTWIFAGSRELPDGTYGADVAGYFVNIVNFDLAMIDVPALVSSSNETLLWEAANDLLPERGQTVTLILEPAGEVQAPNLIETGPTTQPLSDVRTDQQKVDRLRKIWQEKVSPHGKSLREAAQAQYDVIRELRREQQRLIDEADHIQRIIDELEKKYQDMTTPRPEHVN